MLGHHVIECYQMQQDKVSLDDFLETDEHSFSFSLEHIAESIRNKRLADIFRIVSFRKNETYGPHDHLRIEINYVKKGSCIIRTEEGSISFREGETMVILSNTQHLFEAGPHGTVLMQLEFLPDIFKCFNFCDQNETGTPLFCYMETNKILKIVNHVGIMRTIQRIVNEMRRKDQFYKHLVVMYYAELLILIFRYMKDVYLPNGTNVFLKEAIRYIQANYQSQLTISGIAQNVNISERYLRKLFDTSLGISPLEYLNQLRIKKALTLIRSTEMSIKEICYTCGFQSPQYFSRVFKQQTGMTPKEAAN